MTIGEDGDTEANYTVLALTSRGVNDAMMQRFGKSLQPIGIFRKISQDPNSPKISRERNASNDEMYDTHEQIPERTDQLPVSLLLRLFGILNL